MNKVPNAAAALKDQAPEASLSTSGAEQGDVAAAKRVLHQEADALRRLADESRRRAPARRSTSWPAVTGRVIVTGMGKSRPYRAQDRGDASPRPERRRSSCHPAEASHGDLGMVTSSDAVVALSNSGETVELSDILGFCPALEYPC